MIENFAQTLLRGLEEEIKMRMDALAIGCGSFDKDERKRGEITGLRIAQTEINDLLARARKQENDE